MRAERVSGASLPPPQMLPLCFCCLVTLCKQVGNEGRMGEGTPPPLFLLAVERATATAFALMRLKVMQPIGCASDFGSRFNDIPLQIAFERTAEEELALSASFAKKHRAVNKCLSLGSFSKDPLYHS